MPRFYLKIGLKGVAVSALLIVLVLGMFQLGYLYGQSLNSSAPIVIEPKSFVEPASYIVFGEDMDGDKVLDIIYAKNGWTSEIDFIGTDASSVIQQVVDTLLQKGGGTIYIKGGIYKITKSIILGYSIKIIGDPPAWWYFSDYSGAGNAPEPVGTIFNCTPQGTVDYVFKASENLNGTQGIQLINLGVINAGMIKLGDDGVFGGYHIWLENLFGYVENVTADIALVHIDNSLFVMGKQLMAVHYPVLVFRNSVDYWRTGNSVFENVYGQSAPYSIKLCATNSTLNLITLIRPQSLHVIEAGIILEGIEDGEVAGITIISPNLELASGAVNVKVIGRVNSIYIESPHQNWWNRGIVRLVRGPSGEYGAGDIFGWIVSIHMEPPYDFEKDDNGKIIVYDYGEQTYNTYDPPKIVRAWNPEVYWGWYIYAQADGSPPGFNLVSIQDNPDAYGGANNPFVRPVHYVYIPAGTTLVAGENDFDYYTRITYYNNRVQSIVQVISGDPSDLAGLVISAEWVSTSNNVAHCRIKIYNTAGTNITLSSNLALVVVDIPLVNAG